MGKSDGVRNTDHARVIPRCAGRASFSFCVQMKKVIFAALGCLLMSTTGLAWAPPPIHPSQAGRTWVDASWPQQGPQRYGHPGFGSPGITRQQQQSQEHLPQWFRQHQYLPPWAQERALRSEPGFNRLPPSEQQRLLIRLRQLDSMPPQKRERTLQWMEALERLSPERRQRVRSTMQRLTQMPADRRRMMHRAFLDLSQLPPGQREEILNSPQFRTQFSDEEREILETLMSVQPYNPEPRPYPGMGYGGRR